MDDLTEQQRHKNMQHIKSRNTKPEEVVRKYLFSQGFRYRKNDKRYPGKPDIVLPKYHTVIFINGCFWHQHNGCRYAVIPQTKTDYWIPKLKRNVERDQENYSALQADGWHVIIVWECQLRTKEKREQTLPALASQIRTLD